ncbi:hypothetical protein [Empedobacter falsenii]|uniref:Uncharacterized protein n=1 Tax=Empedobacter falsenii TaxID=343874 RepID=A0A3R8TMD5_9FLAO|nr:hypothetical protein [Empedobacter falsenii]RRT92832.1 hypothetical protein EGI89_04520 [Empedobacter falsenii]RRT93093.1 hypothetical protein EGI88_05180 [Empedobacter falsenii]
MKKILLAIAFAAPSVFVLAQVGIGTNDPKATLDVTAVNSTGTLETVEGVLIPRVDRERAQSMLNVDKSTMVFINNISTGSQTGTAININAEGFYYFDGLVWVKLSSGNTNPNFFYMPSIVLPTVPSDSRVIDTTNESYTFDKDTSVYTVKLHDLYKAQFTTPVIASSATASLSQIVLKANNYDYFVTYADNTVFTDIKIDDNGILTYKVTSNAIIRNGSFMNIVLKVR